ncbi:MAG: OmpL47-type beta-barrel domain-containing protein [Gaiellaceae bacterium]
MNHSNYLRRSRAGHNGSPAPAFRAFEHRVVLLFLVGAASFLIVAGATLTSTGPFGHGHSTARPLPSWPESNTLVARQNHSADARASLTVRFQRGTSTAVVHRLLARFGAVETSSVGKLDLHILSVAPSKAHALLEALRSEQAVASATPDDVRQLAGDTATDAIAGQWALPKIGALLAQRSATSKRAVTIAVLDTGVDATHPALAGHVVAGHSAFTGFPASTDANGHGTWMASIALAADPAARVMPVRVLNNEGLGKDSDIIKGLVWAADHDANVIAMSFAGDGYSPALQRAIDYAWSRGSVVVAATGNSGSSKPTYPAGDAKVVGVSATDSHDELWSGSNFGRDVTLAAPGVDIVAAAAGGGTTTITGTSASAALVAGAAALLLGADAKATNATVVGRLARNATQAGSVEQTGNGRLNLLQALFDTSKAPLVTAGVQGRQAGGPFVGPYGIAGSSTTPTVVASGLCPNTTGLICTATAGTLVLTLSAAVPLNSTLFIVAGLNVSNTGNFSATDNLVTHNTFTQDQHMNNTGQSVSLLRSPITQPLASGNTITITYPATSTVLKEATIFYVSGLITTSPMDSTAGTGSANTANAAASTGSTTSGNVLVVGGVASATVGAASNSCTALTSAGTAGTSTEEPVYKTSTATGILTCGATVTSGRWSAVTAAYRVDVTNATAAVTFPGAASYNAAGWAAITGSGTDESGGSGIDTTAGKTQLSIHDDTSNQYWTGGAWGAVAGAETYVNPTTGPTAVSPGTAATWNYTFANTNLANAHSYTVHAKTIDLAGNTSTVATATTNYDTAAPTAATLTTNSSYNAAGWSGHVDGTTTDSGNGNNGISAVNVSIADSVSGKCWNGTDFTTAGCPSWNAVSTGGTATGANNASWQYNVASAALSDGHTYTVSVQATDATTTGNVSGTLAAGTFKYDTTPPAFGTLSYVLSGSCNANLYASGATIYYNPSVAVCANAFNARAVVTDATSGPASVNFPAIATGSFAHSNETISGASPYTSALNYGWSSTAASFSSPSTLTATDIAGNTSTSDITITKDANAPGGGVISVPATVKTLSVPITTTPATDGASGLAAATNTISRSNGQAVSGNACPGSGYTGATTVTSPDTGVANGQCYLYTLTATDKVGNTATWTSNPVMVDTVAPTDAFALTSVTGGVYKSGATIYYKGDAAGSFKLRDTVTDANSGPASAIFGLLSGLTGASHSAETISTPVGGPYDSSAISWATASGTGSLAAHGTDIATNSQTDTTFTLTLDNGAPAGGSISVPAYATSSSVTIASGNYTDGGSGIASNVLTRSNGQSPIGGICPAAGTFTGSTVVTSPDTAVVDGQCYVYTLTGADNVGNSVSLVTTNAVLVDGTAPSDAITLTAGTGAYKSGTTIYYKGDALGSFELRDTVTDASSGPASATFGLLSGGTGFAAHSSETITGSSPYASTAITWTAAASGSPTIPVHSTDAAGTSSSETTLTLGLDNSAPTGGSISVPAYTTSTSVTTTSGNFIDGGSGLSGASNVITRSNGQAPVAGVCPGSGYTGATTVTSPDTGVANGQCYVYTLTATDKVGNTATISSSPVLVDTGAPTDTFTLTAATGAHKSGGTIYYKGDAAGSFTLRNTVTDAVSGPASATFGALSGLTGASHSDETVGGSSPYDSTAISWASASGAGSLAAHGTDAAGNSATDTTFALTLDNGGPTGGSISVPAYATSASVTIASGNYTDSGSGIASNTLTRSNGQSPIAGVCPGSGYTGATVVPNPDTGVSNGQCYVYTLTGTDNVGNTAAVATSPVLIDTAAPAYASAALDAAGTHVDVRFTEAESGLDSGSTTPTSAFTVTGATISGLSYTDATHIRLTLASRLFGDATPTVAYNPGALTTGQKVKDTAGNLLGSVSAQFISMSAVASLSQSTVTATPGAINANGTSTSTITVQLKNAAGTNLAPGAGTVSLAVGAGSLGSVTNHDDGTYTATLTSSTVAQSVTVSGQLDGSGLASSAPVSYVAGPAAKLTFGVEPPASAIAGQTLSPSVTVRILDANDNLVTSSSAAVTVALGANPGSSTLSGTKTSSALAGVATFGDLSLNKTGTGYTLVATSGSLSGATSSSYDITPASAATIAANGGDGQSANVNTNVATPPSVLVSDQFGNPVQGTPVTFAIASGGGSQTGGSAATDASGVATVGSWKLGAAAGANTLTATSAGLTGSPVTFSATGVVAAANIAVNDGDGQSATVDTNVSTAPSVLVTDTFGSPVSGVPVTFVVASGDGSATGASATTNASGIATLGSWKLGTTAGANTLTATYGGPRDVTFNATGIAGAANSMAINSGQGQTATVNTNVATAPAVLVTDTHGNPVAGVAVNFAIGSGGGSLAGGNTTTNASGLATVGSWKLGTAAGANTLTATSAGLSGSPIAFNATSTPGAATALAVNAGDNQSATVDTNLSSAPSVKAADQFGNGVPSVNVTFAVASGGGSATGTSDTTDAGGVATIGSWKLGTAAGANTLTATSPGLGGSPVTLNATGTAAAAATLSALSGEGQSATVNTIVSTAPSVRVVDSFGNPVVGVAVTFAIDSGGGSVTGGSATTTGSGVATVGSWTLGTGAGANMLAATSGGLNGSPVTFTAAGTADSAAALAVNGGNNQSKTVDTNLATAPSVKVTDQFGNPVSGVGVTFAVVSGGGSATGLSPSTNASGVAAVGSWKLGTVGGANTLSASSGSLTGSPLTFTANGNAGNVDHLILSPATVSITADDSQTYAVQGRDMFDNSIGDVTGATTLSVAGGTCLGAVCSAPATGVHTVTGSFLGAVGNATLTVGAGAPDHLAFTAGGTGNLALGASRLFTVAVQDAHNNIVSSNDATSVTFARTAGPGELTGLGSVIVSAGAASKSVTASVEGQVTLTASATGLTSASATFTVDPAPITAIDDAPVDPSTSAAATFAYSANDSTATFECRLDGAAYAACPGTGSGSKSYTGLASGGHTFDVRALSATATGPHAHAAWMVDTTSPALSLTLPADGSYVKTATRALAASASDTGTGVGAVDFEFSSTPSADCSTGSWTLIASDTTGTYDATWTTPADGTYAVRAVAHDGAGHSSCSLVHVTVDQTAPTATLVSPAANVRGGVTLHATGVADATSGLNSVSFERAPSGTSSWALVGNGVAAGGGAYDAPFDTTGLSDGAYDFRISVTDIAGNLSQRIVGPIRIDNTPPTSTIDPVATNVRQTIALAADAVDAGSGVASTGYEISAHGAGTWTGIPASFDTTTTADGDYDLRSVATDNVGNIGYSAPVTTKIDNTPPVATLDAIARYVRGSLTLGSSTNDAGSGLATVHYELSAHSANSWSTITAPLDTSTQADGDHDFRVVAIDNAGNRTDSAAQLVTIDNTAPNAQLDDPASSSIKRGTIMLASTISDGTSGVATFGYRVAPAGTPEASPCGSWGAAAAQSFDTTALADGFYDFRVIAVDNSGNGGCSAISTSVRIDNTAPVTTDNAPAGPRNSDVTVNLSASDGGSGVTATVYTVDGGPQQSGTTVVIPAAVNDGTHTIAYHSTDAAGNVEPTRSAQVHVDTTAPAGGSGNGGDAVRGNLVLTDSPTDTIASVEFQYRTGASGAWMSIGTDTDGSEGWHVTWDTTSVGDDTYHLQMIETDDAGNPTVTPLADTVVDNTAPTSASVSVGGCGARCSGTVTLTGSADASVSGIGAMVFEVKGSGASAFTPVATQTSGFSFTWSSTTVADGAADIRVAVTDRAGNGPTYSPVTTVTVDNNAPTVTLTVPSAVSGTVSLGATGSADIASVAYAISPSGAATWTTLGSASAPSPFIFAWASGTRPDGAYDLRVTATDGGGNQSSNIKAVTIDNTGPTGALTQPAANATVGGPSVALASTSTDSGTGVAGVTYQYRANGPGSFTDISGSTWDATTVPSGNYDLRARITDNADNVAFTGVRSVTVDSTPPALSLASLGTLLAGTLTIDAAVSGASQAMLQVRAAGGGWVAVGNSSAAPFRITFDSSSITDGVYDVRVVAVDAFGNQASDARTGITFDNTAPQLTASTPEDGGVLPNGSTISELWLTASEPLQSVTNVKVDGQPVLAAPVVTGATVNVALDATVADGLHAFTGKLTDLAGRISSFRINTTILAPAGFAQPPIVSKNALPNSQTVLTSPASGATVFVPANAYDVPFGHEDDFLVLSMAPQVSPIAPLSGMTMTGSIVDVTMDWNSNGDSLHVFRVPLAITMTDPTGGLAIPATYQNGEWRLIPMISSPVLPAGQQDGFYRDATGVHVLTKHLTLFALVRDVQLPATPSNFSAVVAADGLTLRWSPAPDSGRIEKFLLYVDGQPYRYLGPSEFETKLGAFTADDTRSFALAAFNTSGSSSLPTTPLQAVPNITGRSVEDATATLATRGFTAGRLMPVASSEPAGTVVGPSRVQLLPAGSIVDLQVSTPSVRHAPFVFQIAVQKRVRPMNRALAVRILATAPAKISATLDGVNYQRIQRWSFLATTGASVHTLRLAHKLQPGTYTLYWLGRTADGATYRTSQKIRVLAQRAKR